MANNSNKFNTTHANAHQIGNNSCKLRQVLILLTIRMDGMKLLRQHKEWEENIQMPKRIL